MQVWSVRPIKACFVFGPSATATSGWWAEMCQQDKQAMGQGHHRAVEWRGEHHRAVEQTMYMFVYASTGCSLKIVFFLEIL